MNTVEIIFSPTGGTEKVAHIISRQWSENTVIIDLCDVNTDFTKCKIAKDDMVLIAMPSFGGRAPAVAIDSHEFRLSQIKDALKLVNNGHTNGKVVVRFP